MRTDDPSVTLSILNVAAYRFVSIDDPAALRETLQSAALTHNLRGTILLAHEGINLFLAGAHERVERFIATYLESDVRFAGLDYKRSESDSVPFKRMKVRVRPEIVTFAQGVNPAVTPAPSLDAATLKRWLDEGKDLVLLDTRNTFEFERGAFEGSEHLGNDNFRAFASAVKNAPAEWRHKPVITFCTGGIRCEKAAPFLIAQGFEQVYQLQGGILRYFELEGQAHYRGDCFVFDERRALDGALAVSHSDGPIMGSALNQASGTAAAHADED
jgi:UPF0176 protein